MNIIEKGSCFIVDERNIDRSKYKEVFTDTAAKEFIWELRIDTLRAKNFRHLLRVLKFDTALKLSPGNPFGLNISLAIAPGRFYELSIRREGNASEGVLVASAKNSAVFYKSNSVISGNVKGSRDLLKLTFGIPSSFKDSALSIYLWDKGKSDIHFEDLEIREYDR